MSASLVGSEMCIRDRNITGLSVNPARSLAPAVLVGGAALQQVWIFILAPIVGGVLAALVAKNFLGTEE